MSGLVRRTGWALTFAVLAVFFQSFVRQPMAWPLIAGLAGLALTSALRPYVGLLILAGVGPLAAIIYAIGQGQAGNAVFAEGIALAFLTGWTANQAITGKPLQVPVAVRWPALFLALLAAASGVVHWSGMRAEQPDETLRTLLDWYVLRDYPFRPPGHDPVTASVLFVSGMLIALAAADICAGAAERRRQVLRVMVIGAAAAALFNVRRIVEASLRADEPLKAFLYHVVHTRVSVHYGDKNAAGSYFALLLVIATGFMSGHRILAIVTLVTISIALWMTGSRVAYAAALVALVGLIAMRIWQPSSRWSRRQAVTALASVLVFAAAGYVWYPTNRNLPASEALGIRVGLSEAALAMTAHEPVFGVGLGRFYRLSETYAGVTLARFGFTRENAHNNFLQVLAELGVPGLVAFVIFLASALLTLWRSESPRSLHGTALAMGVIAFILTAFAGHPLLTPGAAYPFFLAVGLATAPMAIAASTRTAPRAVLVVMVLAVIVTVPWRASEAAAGADLSEYSRGFSLWQPESGGWRYRYMDGHAYFYVPSAARSVLLRLRIGIIVRRPIEITVRVDGQEVNRIIIGANDQWFPMRFLVRKPASGARYVRVELIAREPGQPPFATTATPYSGIVMVRRPEIEY